MGQEVGFFLLLIYYITKFFYSLFIIRLYYCSYCALQIESVFQMLGTRFFFFFFFSRLFNKPNTQG